MKIALSLLFFYVVYSNATVINDIILEEWEDWKVFHGKKYGSEEENNFRMKVFIDNKLKIEKHNDLARQGLKTYTMKLNQYSDLLRNEFMSTANSIKSDMFQIQSNEDNEINSNEGITQIIPANVKLPDAVDWREHGAVTKVKNQGNCGSCWAFSTTGALEGQHFRKTGELVSLSEQNLVDCTRSFGPLGCLGGSKDVVDQAYQYIKSNGGIDTEKGYPYLGKDGFCHFKADKIGATDKGFVDIKSMDENALKAAVATIGPVSVLIHASDGFLNYGQGLFNEPECSSTRLNHAVLVVGYGTSEKGEYWLVKNSYGKSWGEEGYIKMSRNKNNQCGIATKASYPVV